MRLKWLSAAALMAAGSGWSAPALASDWGCQVLLCLSNPGGPTQYGACVPPITKLWDTLATGGFFPICSAGNVVKSKLHGHRGSSDYRVTMTYQNGAQSSYSLAGIAQAGAMSSPVGQQP